MLDILEKKFIDKVEENKLILRRLITRYNRAEKYKKSCKQSMLRNGNSKFLESVIKRYDKEIEDLNHSKHLIRCAIWQHSRTICRLREVRRGHSKQSVDWILMKSVLGG